MNAYNAFMLDIDTAKNSDELDAVSNRIDALKDNMTLPHLCALDKRLTERRLELVISQSYKRR